MKKTGRCLCGAVRFVAEDVPRAAGICHCRMCRKHFGAAGITVDVAEDRVSWEGRDRIATRASSGFAERAWCKDCGTPLFFRMTEENDYSGTYGLPVGLFDDSDGFTLDHEIFIDEKPAFYAFGGDHVRLTRAECIAKFPKLVEAGTG